jgi:hypothetical protein
MASRQWPNVTIKHMLRCVKRVAKLIFGQMRGRPHAVRAKAVLSWRGRKPVRRRAEVAYIAAAAATQLSLF